MEAKKLSPLEIGCKVQRELNHVVLAAALKDVLFPRVSLCGVIGRVREVSW